jgi:hypothetical protein
MHLNKTTYFHVKEEESFKEERNRVHYGEGISTLRLRDNAIQLIDEKG